MCNLSRVVHYVGCFWAFPQVVGCICVFCRVSCGAFCEGSSRLGCYFDGQVTLLFIFFWSPRSCCRCFAFGELRTLLGVAWNDVFSYASVYASVEIWGCVSPVCSGGRFIVTSSYTPADILCSPRNSVLL